MYFETSFNVPYYGLDSRERIKAGMLLQFLQESAAMHAKRVRIGVSDLQEKGFTWVLRRYRIGIKKHLGHAAGPLSVRTWFEPQKNLVSVRVFEIKDASGDLVADAWSSWIVVDLKKGRPVRLDRALSKGYYDAARDTGDGVEGRVPEIDGDPDSEYTFKVRWSELDLNGHANHTAYFDWVMETVPEDVLAGCVPAELDAEYLAPAMRENIVVRTRKAEESDEAVKFVHSVRISDTGVEAARLSTLWIKEYPYS